MNSEIPKFGISEFRNFREIRNARVKHGKKWQVRKIRRDLPGPPLPRNSGRFGAGCQHMARNGKLEGHGKIWKDPRFPEIP